MEIKSYQEYKELLKNTYDLMCKGESNLTDEETKELEVMAKACEKYEDIVLKLNPPFENDI